ncbi:MAG: hypothetical protein L0K83_07465 [Lactobacillus sp.]|nr:hypothetical protein [Lactobacillus sp.]
MLFVKVNETTVDLNLIKGKPLTLEIYQEAYKLTDQLSLAIK